MPLKKLILICTLITINPLHARVSEEKEERKEKIKQLTIGNFALPASQQPTTLLGFGQNIIPKNEFIGFLNTNFLLGHHKNYTTLDPQIIYGITDKFSVTVNFPIYPHLHVDSDSSSGPGDLFVQLEYLLYENPKPDVSKYITVVGSLFFPIGNFNKNPSTGFGSPAFFLGFTAGRLAIDWYCYTSYGAILPTRHGHHNKAGNIFYYQGGVGRNISYATDKWILSWLLEVDGIYKQKQRVHGVKDDSSGGNNVYLCPSVFFSTQNLIFQFGVAPAIFSHQNGIQPKNKALISLTLGWKFN